jgi:shikimate dehydrogenase
MQSVTLKCIEELGSDKLGLPPQFSQTKQIEATIESIYSKKMGELTKNDFKGSSPDVQSVSDLKFHLGLIYNLDLDALTDEFYVTVLKINYQKINPMTKTKLRLENLVQNGLWSIAKQPPKNPQDFKSEKLMITLINHDYPARTPLLWNSAFSDFQIPAKSLVLVPQNEEVTLEELKWTLNAYRDDNRFIAGGFGVGFKDETLELLDILDDSAANVGAANFVYKNKNGQLVGYNTDGTGFVKGLQENFSFLQDLTNKKVLILGSGGTANAISFALTKVGAKLIIANRTESKAQALASEINHFYQLDKNNQVISCGENQIEKYLTDLDLVVNTSIKGAEGKWSYYSALASTELELEKNLRQSEVLLKMLPKNCVVADIVLRLSDTPLISQAKKIGLATLDGMPMVISQAALAFTLSYGEKLGIGFSEAYASMRRASN